MVAVPAASFLSRFLPLEDDLVPRSFSVF